MKNASIKKKELLYTCLLDVFADKYSRSFAYFSYFMVDQQGYPKDIVKIIFSNIFANDDRITDIKNILPPARKRPRPVEKIGGEKATTKRRKYNF